MYTNNFVGRNLKIKFDEAACQTCSAGILLLVTTCRFSVYSQKSVLVGVYKSDSAFLVWL